MASRKKPTAFDCFAGCGGMSEGFKQAGFKVIGAIEIDPRAVKTYKMNHPRVDTWNRDVKEISGREILNSLNLKKGELDLLGGCPPCQGFSSLRTMNGNRFIQDDRNDLIFEFQRLVLALLPKMVMLENVPQLSLDNRFSKFCRKLKSVGYEIKHDVLDVACYGVPQRRRRTILVASRIGSPEFATSSEKIMTVRKAIGSLPPAGTSGDAVHDMPEKRSEIVKKRIKSIPTDGGGRTSLPDDLVLDCHRDYGGFKDVYGRMAWEALAPTITTGCFNPSKGRFLHPCENRAVTIREAAILQSFPATYKFPVELGKVKLAQMIGNALPPEFIKRHAKALLEIFNHD